MPFLYLGNFRENLEFLENCLSATETQLSNEKRVFKGNVVKNNPQPTVFHLEIKILTNCYFLGALPVLKQFS